ncbi:LysR family transcriptional regulator [Rhodopseudomonas sp. AAP120]|uniref:LysR family transcriptional regulator n=1 Tax=Rhodopseudomonas sp. AAP120 TaxID=1523430 RepID=UPI0006B9C41A|nr:LysR family transcriptional regulator [Rhodopseudomonas sp. AAP120]KPG00038.1 LysR family transcriptional regulator [Rhodopseudomonas sp. AAP120]
MGTINLRKVDLNLLIVFDAVYSTGNISHAARQLALSQPAVSNALTRLREHLDDPLFVRSGRGVEPTLRSQQMIEPLREALRLIRQQFDGERRLELGSYKRTFRIVIADMLEGLLMPPLLREIAAHAPQITIESRPSWNSSVTDDILAGTLDLACYVFPVSAPGLVFETICPCDYIVVARRGHPQIGAELDTETFLALEQVAPIPELRSHSTIDRDITIGGGVRRIAYMVHKAWSIPAVVGSTDLIGILPRRFAELMAPKFGLQIFESPVPISPQDYHLIWHQRNTDDPGHRWLREAMLKTLRADARSGLVPAASAC